MDVLSRFKTFFLFSTLLTFFFNFFSDVLTSMLQSVAGLGRYQVIYCLVNRGTCGWTTCLVAAWQHNDQTVNQTGDLQQRPSCTCRVLKRHRLIYDSRRKKKTTRCVRSQSAAIVVTAWSRCRPTHNVLSRADNTSRQSKKRTPLFIERYETLGSRVVSVLDSGAEGPGSNRSRDALG